MPSSVDNEYASLSAVYGPGLSIQDMRLRKYGGPTVPAKSVADLEYMYWGPSTSLSNADKKLAYLQNQTGKTGQSIDDLTSLSIGSATTTVRNIVDRPAPVALTSWSSNNSSMWLHTYSGGTVSVERIAGATGFITASPLTTGSAVGNPMLPAGSQWQRSVEVFSTVPVTVTQAVTGGFPTGQVIPANIWTTIRNNFVGTGIAQYVMCFRLDAASDPGLGILTQLRHAMLVRDDSVWRTNQAINPGYEGAALTSILTGSSGSYPVTTDTVAPISGTKSALFTRAGTLTSTIAQILGASGISSGKFTVTAGQPVTGGLSIKTDVPNAQVSTRWFWYDSGSVLTTGNLTTRYTNMNANQVYRAVDTDTPPPGTVTAYFVVTVLTNSGNAALGNQVWADLLTLEYGTTDGSPLGVTNGLASFTGAVDASTSVVATKQIAYADGGSPNWTWEGTANASPSTGPVSYVPDNRINLATNPGYESGANSFISANGTVYSISGDTITPINGTRSCLSTRIGANSSIVATILGTTTQVRMTLTPGQPVTGGMTVKTDVPNAKITSWWYWYDGTNTTQGTAITNVAAAVAGQTYRIINTDTPIAGTVSGWMAVSVTMPSGFTVGGEKVWADMLTLEYGTTDGSWF